MGKAHIFFAFANAPADPRRFLSNLEEEKNRLLSIMLLQKHTLGLLDMDHLTGTTSELLYSHLTKFGHKLSILHYSGHADQLHIELEDANHNIDQLCSLIGKYRNIKLVFLNGCSTKGMVKRLLAKGVKAVIATSDKIEDLSATQFSIAFYESLTEKGTSLKAAFNQACSKSPHLAKAENKKYFNTGAFGSVTELKEAAEKDTLPWGLYYNEADEATLDLPFLSETASTEFDAQINLALQKYEVQIINLEQELVALAARAKKFEESIEKFKKIGEDTAFFQSELDQVLLEKAEKQ
ncbi:MAG: CHAT domain-containing protein, partial [Bacteroidota bacterium]